MCVTVWRCMAMCGTVWVLPWLSYARDRWVVYRPKSMSRDNQVKRFFLVCVHSEDTN